MKWVAKNYQLTALSFLLSNQRSGLFLDCGLGKTSTSLSLIKIIRSAKLSKGILLIAPLRVVYSVWPNEIEKWDNFNHLTHTILHDKTKSTLWGEPKDIYLINPEGLPWLFDELSKKLTNGEKCPFDTLIIDESTKFSNPATKVKKTKRPTRFGYLVNMLPLFKRRHIMTGTPASRTLEQLWSQSFILDEGATLGINFYKFRRKYFYTEDWNSYKWILRDGADNKIHKAIAPLVLEMSAEDHLDIPEILYNYIEVKLPNTAMRLYKEMEKKFFLEWDGLKASAEATAQSSMKCHQISNGRVYEDIPPDLEPEEIRAFKRTRKVIKIHKAKTEALSELIDELNGKPLLIAYHYKHDLDAILEVCGTNTPYIGSGVSPKESKALERLWNAGKLPILIGHPDSMGHGLNLQGSGNDICWYSLPYSLENYIQFNKRIHRQGVRAAVRIHHLVSLGTLDKAILSRLGERAEQQIDLRKAINKYRKLLKC